MKQTWHKRDILLAVIALAGQDGIYRTELQMGRRKEASPLIEHFNNRSERWLVAQAYICKSVRGVHTTDNPSGQRRVHYTITPAGVMYLSSKGFVGFPESLSYYPRAK